MGDKIRTMQPNLIYGNGTRSHCNKLAANNKQSAAAPIISKVSLWPVACTRAGKLVLERVMGRVGKEEGLLGEVLEDMLGNKGKEFDGGHEHRILFSLPHYVLEHMLLRICSGICP